MSDKPKNVIWIFGDQHRAQALGCNGDPNVHTPNIDRLAAEGVTLDGISGCPLCSPYRGSLLTSQYPHNMVPGHQMPLPDNTRTIATAFNEAGYHTGYFGKWHVDGHEERNGRATMHIVPPHRRGDFKQWLGYDNNNSQWDTHVHGHDADGNEIPRYRLPGYETDELTDQTIAYLHERCDDKQPFFCVLSVQPPHDPYVAPEDWMARHTPGGIKFRANVPDIPRVREIAARELAGYYAMIENLDWNVGRVRDALWDLELLEDTHIVFFSDHGDMHGSQGMFRKTNPYEESIRVPLIIGGLGSQYAGRTGRMTPGRCLVNHVDIGPTSLGLCGIDTPAWMAGRDYSAWRLHNRERVAADSAYIGLPVPTGHAHSVNQAWRGLVTSDNWKYVCFENQPWLLFNLNEDPYEQVNLAFNSAYQAKHKQLNERLRQWVIDTGDTFALPEV